MLYLDSKAEVRFLTLTTLNLQGLSMRQIRFRFDGQPINEADTPAQVWKTLVLQIAIKYFIGCMQVKGAWNYSQIIQVQLTQNNLSRVGFLSLWVLSWVLGAEDVWALALSKPVPSAAVGSNPGRCWSFQLCPASTLAWGEPGLKLNATLLSSGNAENLGSFLYRESLRWGIKEMLGWGDFL